MVTNEEGDVVLERDPKLFKYVANYLRLPYRTKIIVPDAETKEDLKAEFSFLSLKPLGEVLTEREYFKEMNGSIVPTCGVLPEHKQNFKLIDDALKAELVYCSD